MFLLLLALLSVPGHAADDSIRQILQTKAKLVRTANGGFVRRKFDVYGHVESYERDRNGDGKVDEKLRRLSPDEYVFERDTRYRGIFDEKVTRLLSRGRLVSEVIERPGERIERTFIHERDVIVEVRLFDEQRNGGFQRMETRRLPLHAMR